MIRPAISTVARLRGAVAVLCCGAAAAAQAATWSPIPGTEDVQVDLGTVQIQRSRVMAWVRWAGRGPLAQYELAAQGTRIYRTTHLAEVHCGQRSVRVLATNAYDSSGRVLLMSTLAGNAVTVAGGDMGWTYDALCEFARTGARE